MFDNVECKEASGRVKVREIPYFFGYKAEIFFPFQNRPQNIDLSEIFFEIFWKVKTHLIRGFRKSEISGVNLERGNPVL